MATFKSGIGNATFETVVAFLGALLVIPLVFKLLGAILRLGIVRKLLLESLLVGLTALLTREDVLDRLFGQRGRTGGGLLRP